MGATNPLANPESNGDPKSKPKRSDTTASTSLNQHRKKDSRSSQTDPAASAKKEATLEAGPATQDKHDKRPLPTRSVTIKDDGDEKSGKKKPKRPGHRDGTLSRQPSVQTRYVQMLLELDEVPRFQNILAAFFTWVLLAGFVIFPGTFTSVQESEKIQEVSENGNPAERVLIKAVKNVPLLWIAGACCLVGAVGLVILWIKWRKNFVWVINRVFL
jgi:hypothetical protein